MDLEYVVTENIHRNRSGQILQIEYQFEESSSMVAPSTAGTGITKQTKEKRQRSYDAAVTRQQYEELARRLPDPLSFEEFTLVLRPFIMGFYASGDLEKAFHTLDRDHSGSIHIDELSSFLPILNDTVTRDGLRNYVRKVDTNFDGNMNYEEFRALVLRGIGRDIICNHI
jgi:Ca2+-binding EF-hand superfamily protein